MVGKINSIESMGLVDGPGVRYVVFMQGCPLRCIFCHNPETWNINNYNETYTPKDLVDKILRYKPYFKNGGGVTFSGGEPLMQKEFLLECLKLLKKENVHTAIDTAGTITNCEEILKYTDLVLFDIKALDDKNYNKITSGNINNSLKFLELCQKMDKKLWIRQVIIPGINDNIKCINRLIDFIKPLKNVEKVELLPYHTLGVHKYEKLGIKYSLNGVPAMDKEKCKKLEEQLIKGLER